MAMEIKLQIHQLETSYSTNKLRLNSIIYYIVDYYTLTLWFEEAVASFITAIKMTPYLYMGFLQTI